MSFQEFAGCILRGSEAAKPAHASYFTDFKYEALDTGNVYYDNGSAWVLLSGAEKAEALKNKIVNFDNNTINGVLRDPFSTNKRFGYIIPAVTAAASTQVALKGWPSDGAYSLFYDATKGYVSRFSSSAIENLGWNAVIPIITRREWNPRLKVEMRSSTVSNLNMWMGFSSLPIALGNGPSDVLNHSVFAGMGSGFSANYTSIRNDGTNDTGVNVGFGVPRDTVWNTFEIIMTETDVTVKMNATTLNFTTRLPGLTQNLMVYIHYRNRDTFAKTFDVARAYFESDIV